MALEANSDWQRQSIKGKSLLTSFRFRSLTRFNPDVDFYQWV
jgi:hypothetical protein